MVTFDLNAGEFAQCRLEDLLYIPLGLRIYRHRSQAQMDARLKKTVSGERGARVGVEVSQYVNGDLVFRRFWDAIPCAWGDHHAPYCSIVTTTPRHRRVVSDPTALPKAIDVMPDRALFLAQRISKLAGTRRVFTKKRIDTHPQLVRENPHQLMVDEGCGRNKPGPSVLQLQANASAVCAHPLNPLGP